MTQGDGLAALFDTGAQAADRIEAQAKLIAKAEATILSLLYVIEDDGSDYIEVAAKARTLLASIKELT